MTPLSDPKALGFGMATAAVAEIATPHHMDPTQLLGIGGIFAVLFWILLKDKMDRSKKDTDGKDRLQERLVDLVERQIAAQTRFNDSLENLATQVRASTVSIDRLIQVLEERKCPAFERMVELTKDKS